MALSMADATEGARQGFAVDPVSRGVLSLLHPLVIGAIAVLLLNDHYLKAEYPGWLTGKVSDFSGLVFFPLLLGVLIASITRSRHSQAIASFATLAWFTAIKISGVMAGLTESIVEAVLGLPIQIIADPSDLIALPMVGVGWEIWRRAGSRDAAKRRRFRTVAVVAVAAFASVATSYQPLPAVVSIDNTDTEVWAEVDNDYGPTDGYRSGDGGVTWESAAVPASVRFDRTRSDPDGVRCEGLNNSTCYLRTDIWLVEESENGGIDWQEVAASEQLVDIFDQGTFRIGKIVWDDGSYYRGLSDGSWENTGDGGMTWTAGTPINTQDVRVSTGGSCLIQEPQQCYRGRVSGVSYAVSPDGGITWAALPPEVMTPYPWVSSLSTDAWQVRGVACLGEGRGRCYRAFDPDGDALPRLEVSTDQGSTWRPSWTPSPRLPDRDRFAPQDVAVDERTGNVVVGIGSGGVAIRTPTGRWITAPVGPADGYTNPPAFPPSSGAMMALWAIWTFAVSLAGGLWLVSEPPITRGANWRLASTVLLATAAMTAIIVATADYPYTLTIGPSWLRGPAVLTVSIVIPVVLGWLLMSWSAKHVPQNKVWRVWIRAAGISLVPIVVFQVTNMRWV